MSLGFGQYAFGIAMFGYAPVVVADPRGPNVPAAMRYDGKTSDWALTTDNRPRSVHSVDQGVAFSICFKRGTIKSAPEIGNDFQDIELTGGARDQGEIEACARNAYPLRLYLADGRVTLQLVQYDEIPTGGYKVVVYYRNNETGKADRAIYES
jgi:hypothetical protein